jgi:serine protease Do
MMDLAPRKITIPRPKGRHLALAMTVVFTAWGSAQSVEDPLLALQDRSNRVFEKANPSVVGIRTRVRLPYAAQLSPDGRIEWYLRTGAFRLPEASQARTLIRDDHGNWTPFGQGTQTVSPPQTWVNRYGTGILFDDAGHILTTYQLVKDSTQGSEIAAISASGLETPASLVAADPYSNIAVIRSEGIEGVPAGFVDSGNQQAGGLREGSFVFCVARPYGLPNSAYFGMVSGLDRQVGQFRYERLIQTTVPLPPGSYGAPLLTMDGLVAGMMSCTLKQESWTEVSFAIPAAMVQRIGKDLIERGSVSRGYLGVRVVNRDELPAEKRKARSETHLPPGALVRQVLPGTPAAEAGLLPDDLIVAIDGSAITGWEDLVWALNTLEPGQKVTVRVMRGERKLRLPLQLGKLPLEVQHLDRRR